MEEGTAILRPDRGFGLSGHLKPLTVEIHSMEIHRPDKAMPSVLVLGEDPIATGTLCRLLRSLGLQAQRTQSPQEALGLFFEAGGHEALLTLGPQGQAQDDARDALLDISPELKLRHFEGLPPLGVLEQLAKEIS
jgi:hypothetical protein